MRGQDEMIIVDPRNMFFTIAGPGGARLQNIFTITGPGGGRVQQIFHHCGSQRS
jgi:hypothetical protein